MQKTNKTRTKLLRRLILCSVLLIPSIITLTKTDIAQAANSTKLQKAKVGFQTTTKKPTKTKKKVSQSYKVKNGKLYKGSKLYKKQKLYQGVLYVDAKKATGQYTVDGNERYYKSGKLFTGLLEGYYYESGKEPGRYVVYKNKLYTPDGWPNEGFRIYNGLLYDGEDLNTGALIYQSKLYYGAKINSGYRIFDGELYYGAYLRKSKTVYKDRLYTNAKPNVGYSTYNKKLYDGSYLNEGYFLYNDILYNDAEYNMGYTLFEDRLYNGKEENYGIAKFDGQYYYHTDIANGKYGGNLYEDGELVRNATTIKSIRIVDTKTLEVTYSQAVNNKKPLINVEKNGVLYTISAFKWNKAKTVSTFDLSGPITAGKYNITILGIDNIKLFGSIGVEGESALHIADANYGYEMVED
ncbi:hypothetical protein BK128_04455 [Viridibacillus sp. FSL H7-0596]|uniref:hypothetical protein n=1 Tax=Viridibacillus sp. FSL H7-0596 TaxID=1928923 RepID=UPI00096BFBDE|nr:hypothetical protein [Viridibacillus sp. FSL H7-0596]OMC89184.1 hypothetical protein BK128_04455 [Viridibacillus sp. FSL H7-0596]